MNARTKASMNARRLTAAALPLTLALATLLAGSPARAQPAPAAKRPAPGPAVPAPPPAANPGFAASGIADWTRPPAATAEPRFRPPVARALQLGNGMKLLVVENHELPIVALTLLVPGAGATADPAGKLGLASFTADLLDEGAGDLAALAIAEELDRLGADLQVFAESDDAGVAMRTLSKTLDPTLELLAKVLSQPRFDEREVERVRGDRLTALEQRRDRPREVAYMLLSGHLHGARSPYGHPIAGYADDLRACSVADVRAFYRERWNPARMTLVVAGDVDAAALRGKLERKLGGWKVSAAAPGSGAAGGAPAAGRPPPDKDPVPLPRPASRLLVTDRPGAAQSDVRIGLVGPARKDRRYFAFEVLRTTLGDGFTSRLTQRLREQLGITYGARAAMDWRQKPGTFSIGTALVTASTGEGIAETLAILRDLATRDVPPAELEKSKQNMIRALPAEFETNLATAGAIATLVQLGLPTSWYGGYAAGVRKVTARDVRTAAAQLMPAGAMIVSVVGDLAKIQAALDKLGLGAPIVHDAYGLPRPAPSK